MTKHDGAFLNISKSWIKTLCYSLFVWLLALPLMFLHVHLANMGFAYAMGFGVSLLPINLICFTVMIFKKYGFLKWRHVDIRMYLQIGLKLILILGQSSINYFIAMAISLSVKQTKLIAFMHTISLVYLTDVILILFVWKFHDILKSIFGCCGSKVSADHASITDGGVI
ncbi:uncharacterized protein LOC109613470 [Musca domestica]|uniref:Uncharacterized protein LOC109613470 n=1 Tax=Musca domestica TaxID=7370 RepID=A0ABM3URP7_MUSDO|nr:uncharacterized protein LOC109613470 [Musca domestica]